MKLRLHLFLFICSAAAALSGCQHLPPGGAGEWHTSFGVPGVFKATTDNTEIKVTEKKVTAATHEVTLQILLFELKSGGKNVVLANPADDKPAAPK